MSKFKAGDKVYDICEGVGVVGTDTDKEYPVSVNFASGTSATYTSSGLNQVTDVNPTLLTLEEARTKGYEMPKQKRQRTDVRYCTPEDLDGTFCAMYQHPAHIPLGFPIVTATFTWEEDI